MIGVVSLRQGLEAAAAAGLDGDADLTRKLTTTYDITTLTRPLVEAYGRLTGRADVLALAEPEAFQRFAADRQLVEDAQRAAADGVGTGPGGHCRASQESSAVDLPLHVDTSDQPLPGPAEKTLRRTG